MTLTKNIRLGLLHVAVAVSLVPITSTLNRVMINELGIWASVVAVLVILPYVFSPLQIWIGQYSDKHPIAGYRRTPYIAAGLLLCIGGAVLTPHAALLMARDFWLGFGLGLVAFGSWGLGFNLAVVAYLSLASDMSTEAQRSRTIAVMWFMMIASVIITAIGVGAAVEQYSPAALVGAFNLTACVALALGAAGLIGLEPRYTAAPDEQRISQRTAIRTVIRNPQARLFFVYLILLLSAILGQDILLEPFGAAAFGMSTGATTQLTALWGSTVLLALLLHGFVLSRHISKKTGAFVGGSIAAAGLLLIGISGLSGSEALFYPGIAALGFGTGIATATNLALMLDMTTTAQVGLYIGAWGVADSLARGTGTLLGGVLRDVITIGTGSPIHGYVSVFLIEALMLALALLLLRRIDVVAFRRQEPSLNEIVAMSPDAN